MGTYVPRSQGKGVPKQGYLGGLYEAGQTWRDRKSVTNQKENINDIKSDQIKQIPLIKNAFNYNHQIKSKQTIFFKQN